MVWKKWFFKNYKIIVPTQNDSKNMSGLAKYFLKTTKFERFAFYLPYFLDPSNERMNDGNLSYIQWAFI
jgi:hypothetical protein